jgi:hypothetical protein
MSCCSTSQSPEQERKPHGHQDRVKNLNHPGKVKSVDAAMYAAMRRAYLQIVPKEAPGLTLDAIRERLPAALSQELFSGRAKANWWAKTVQLDLEARGIIVRDTSSPLRIRKVREWPG